MPSHLSLLASCPEPEALVPRVSTLWRGVRCRIRCFPTADARHCRPALNRSASGSTRPSSRTATASHESDQNACRPDDHQRDGPVTPPGYRGFAFGDVVEMEDDLIGDRDACCRRVVRRPRHGLVCDHCIPARDGRTIAVEHRHRQEEPNHTGNEHQRAHRHIPQPIIHVLLLVIRCRATSLARCFRCVGDTSDDGQRSTRPVPRVSPQRRRHRPHRRHRRRRVRPRCWGHRCHPACHWRLCVQRCRCR